MTKNRLREETSVYWTDADILATLIQVGSASRTDALRTAQTLLQELGSLRAVLEADRQALSVTIYARLQAALELVRRVMEEPLRRGDCMRSPADVRAYVQARLRHHRQEVFAVLFLDNRHRLIAFEELFYGTIDGASVHPREVVRRALHHNAAAAICCHNHPSGIAEPSRADEAITRRLKEALALVDVRLLDHMVVGDNEVVSFAERNLL